MYEGNRMPYLSVVLPVYNETGNLEELDRRLRLALDTQPYSFEIIYVDDGSRDQSAEILTKLTVDHADTTCLIRLRRNFGQTAAMSAGIDQAVGQIIVLLDSDLQNDPRDISTLVAKIEEGYDVVSGWRIERKDSRQRRFSTYAANKIISWTVGVPLHDYGCTLKAYRAEILREVHLYGEMHRFIPAFAASLGASITEVPVNHFPRTSGKSNYGLGRVLKVSLDLLTLKFLMSYSTRPMYIFGGFGIVLSTFGVIFLAIALISRLIYGIHLDNTPLPTLAVVMWALGVQSVLMGLITELLMRTYHESQGKRPYVIREIIPMKQPATDTQTQNAALTYVDNIPLNTEAE